MRVIRCKGYHQVLRSAHTGRLRGRGECKSLCEPWAADAALQQALLDQALVDSRAGLDSFDRPKRIYNAVEGCVFVGVSTNEQDEAYNCYPCEPPPGSLARELLRRAQRSREVLLKATDS